MKRVDYQDPNGNLEEVQEKRNAEIRAWGQKVLADADAAQRGDVTTIDDWDTLDVEAEIESPAPTESQPVIEPEEKTEEAQPEPEVVAEKKETAAQKKKREAEEASAEASSKEE